LTSSSCLTSSSSFLTAKAEVEADASSDVVALERARFLSRTSTRTFLITLDLMFARPPHLKGRTKKGRELSTADGRGQWKRRWVTNWMAEATFVTGERWMLTKSTAFGSDELGPNDSSSEAYARDELLLVVFCERIVRMLNRGEAPNEMR
jgi:hypothetical protein